MQGHADWRSQLDLSCRAFPSSLARSQSPSYAARRIRSMRAQGIASSSQSARSSNALASSDLPPLEQEPTRLIVRLREAGRVHQRSFGRSRRACGIVVRVPAQHREGAPGLALKRRAFERARDERFESPERLRTEERGPHVRRGVGRENGRIVGRALEGFFEERKGAGLVPDPSGRARVDRGDTDRARPCR